MKIYVTILWEYVRLVVEEMIPEVGRQKLADFIDVFCDEGFFTPAETARIIEAGMKWSMRPSEQGFRRFALWVE